MIIHVGESTKEFTAGNRQHTLFTGENWGE